MNTRGCKQNVIFITKPLKKIKNETLLTRTGRNDILNFLIYSGTLIGKCVSIKFAHNLGEI